MENTNGDGIIRLKDIKTPQKILFFLQFQKPRNKNPIFDRYLQQKSWRVKEKVKGLIAGAEEYQIPHRPKRESHREKSPTHLLRNWNQKLMCGAAIKDCKHRYKERKRNMGMVGKCK